MGMSESLFKCDSEVCDFNVLFTSLVVFSPTWNGELEG